MLLGLACFCFLLNTFAQTDPFFVSVEFDGDYKTVTKLKYVWSPSVFEDVMGFKTLVPVCLPVTKLIICELSKSLDITRTFVYFLLFSSPAFTGSFLVLFVCVTHIVI